MHQHMFDGRLARQPELRITQTTNESVCTLRLAHDRWTKDANGEWEKRDTLWLDVTAWGALAERCSEYAKGTKVIVNLRDDLKIRQFRRNDGTIGAALEATANTVEAVQDRPAQNEATAVSADSYEPQAPYELEPAA